VFKPFETYEFTLKSDPSLGAVSIRTDKQKKVEVVRDSKLIRLDIPLVNGPFVVDVTGSATTLFRREVWKTSMVDSNYGVGLWDYDLCMQLRSRGWKLALLTDPNLVAHNDGGGSKEYLEGRYNKEVVANSFTRFQSKWGISAR
jgi:hypothetical protein